MHLKRLNWHLENVLEATHRCLQKFTSIIHNITVTYERCPLKTSISQQLRLSASTLKQHKIQPTNSESNNSINRPKKRSTSIHHEWSNHNGNEDSGRSICLRFKPVAHAFTEASTDDEFLIQLRLLVWSHR